MTATANEYLKDILNKGDLNKLADCFQQMKLGSMLSVVKETITLSTVGASITLSQKAAKIVTCRVSDVTGGAALVGDRIMTDSGGTASAPHAVGTPGVAKLSDDGGTITFDATIKAAVVTYIPRAYVDPVTTKLTR